MIKKQYNKYAVIILAAGTSRRLGRPKQLVKIGQENLLSHAIKAASQVENADIYIVLGAYANEISATIDRGIPTYINPNWEKGMGNSISYGMGQILQLGYNAVILTVCDQPFLAATHFEQLIDRYEKCDGRDIIISRYSTGNGPPSLFDSRHFNQLSNLDGDDGAKNVVKENKDSVGFINFDRGYIDIDEEKDLAQL